MKIYILFISVVLGVVLWACNTEGKSVIRRDVKKAGPAGGGGGGGGGGELQGEEDDDYEEDTCLHRWTTNNEETCGYYGSDEATYEKYKKILTRELNRGNYKDCKWDLKIKGNAILTDNEARALHCYTGNIYQDFNKMTAIGGIHYPKYPYKGLHFFLNRAYKKLAALRKEKKTFYRGVQAEVKTCKKDMITHFDNFGSTSDDMDVASVFASPLMLGAPKDKDKKKVRGTIFVITSDEGVDIKDFSQYQDEKEFLFTSCTRFKVERVDTTGNFTYVFLSEIHEEVKPEAFSAVSGTHPGSPSSTVWCVLLLISALQRGFVYII